MDAKTKAQDWTTTVPDQFWDLKPTLAVGTLVRATRALDPDGANVTPGTLGYVFGETDCYGDGYGPIVQWVGIDPRTGIVTHRGVCNVYPGDVDVVKVHDSVEVMHVPDMIPPPQDTLAAVRALLAYSWNDTGYIYENLTETERKLISAKQFNELVRWVFPAVGQRVAARVRITEGGEGSNG